MTTTMKRSNSSLVDELRSGVDTTPINVKEVKYRYSTVERRSLVTYTVLNDKMEEMNMSEDDWASVVDSFLCSDPSCDRALGCLMGMVVGDSVGAPLEFLPADSSPPNDKQRQHRLEDKLSPEGELVYINERNAFNLARGQWTDDASMGLCLSESLLVHGGYHGGDVRVRYHLWWNFGYCSAFRYCPEENRTSVGLGGNIGKSLDQLTQKFTGKGADDVPWCFESQTGKEDAGNGSLMRLAPIPIRYHTTISQAMDMAEQSSLATHPGPDAANCCRFLAYYISQAINRNQKSKVDNVKFTFHAFLRNKKSDNIKRFTLQTIKEFITSEKRRFPSSSMQKLFALLNSKPPSKKEICWNWKRKQIALEKTIKNRGITYNGYPISSPYFGSFCMDALAMALWAVYHSHSFTDCVVRVVNLCGDADTTGSIAGQMAGAFYGYRSLGQDLLGRKMLSHIRKWDPMHELELRALLLYKDTKDDTARDGSTD